MKLRAKRLPQSSDDNLEPRPGIELLSENFSFDPVGSAAFRVDDIKFDQIVCGIRKFTSRLALEEQMKIHTSWDNLRHTLESLPGKIDNLKKMNITDLPRQSEENDITGYTEDVEEVEAGVLSGNYCPEVVDEGNLEEDISVGIDVCVFTEVLAGRPWVGRVTELLPNKQFTIQWFSRKSGRGKIFRAMMKNDGSPYESVQDFDSIMFWDMSVNRREDSFELTTFWLETMIQEYSKLSN